MCVNWSSHAEISKASLRYTINKQHVYATYSYRHNRSTVGICIPSLFMYFQRTLRCEPTNVGRHFAICATKITQKPYTVSKQHHTHTY